MKGVTFAVTFILTVCVVIGGVVLFPNILGQAATTNNEFVFGFFLGPFCLLLFFAWIGEKAVRRIRKKKV
jgi:hypothetical protein